MQMDEFCRLVKFHPGGSAINEDTPDIFVDAFLSQYMISTENSDGKRAP